MPIPVQLFPSLRLIVWGLPVRVVPLAGGGGSCWIPTASNTSGGPWSNRGWCWISHCSEPNSGIESLSDQDISVPLLRIGIPDKMVDHATPQQSKESLGLTPVQMAERIRRRFELGGRDLAGAASLPAIQS